MKKCLLVFFSAFSIYSNAQLWNNDATVNNPIATTNNTTTKQNIATISDANGGMWVAWEDARNSASTGTDIYIQKINSNGTIAFAADGIVVCNATLNQTSISITDDANGGVVLAWTDGRAGNNDIYAQRISSTGSVMWAANGVVISNTSGVEQLSVIERVNATEVMIGWRDDRNNTLHSTGQDYFMNKLSLTDGSKQWMNDYELVRAANTQTNLRLMRNGNNGVFAVWQDPRAATTNADIYLQIVNNDGTGALTNYGTNLTSVATFNQANAQIISDGAGGAIICWDDNRVANNDQDIYAQRVNASGAIQWTSGGVAIVTVATSNQRNPYLTTDGSNGAIITWQDTRNNTASGNDIFAQRVNGSGVTQWASTGELICNATGSQPNSTSAGFGIISDNTNGAIIYWDDARVGTSDIDVYAQRINNGGIVQWPANGIAIANKTGSNQRAPQGVADGSGRLVIVWQDGRTTANCELYASRVEATGVLPLNFITVNATTNNNSNTITWQTANEVNVASFAVEKSSNGTNFSTIATIAANNLASNQYTITDAAPLNGINYYRIVGTDKDGSKTYSNIVTVQLSNSHTLQLNTYPNPVQNTLNIRCTNIEKGNYTLRIIDAFGKQFVSSKIAVNNSLFNTNVNTTNLAKGNYLVQIINNQGVTINYKSFIKL